MKPSAEVTAVLMVAFVSAVPPASADEGGVTLSPHGCQVYAAWSGNLVWASNLAAEKEKARAELMELDRKTPFSIYALMLNNLDALWATNASWEEVTFLVLYDCIVRQGQYQASTQEP